MIPPRPERTKSIYTKPIDQDKRASMMTGGTGGQPAISEDGEAPTSEGVVRNGKKDRRKKMTDEEVLQKLRTIVRYKHKNTTETTIVVERLFFQHWRSEQKVPQN